MIMHGFWHSPIPRGTVVSLVILVPLACSSLAFCDEIHDAAQAGDAAKVETLLKANPDLVFSRDKTRDGWNREMGWTPLHFAAQKGHKDVAELLLANKADVDAKSTANVTPLHLAALNGHKDVVELLLANKASVNVEFHEGGTPLHLAVLNGHKDVVELLVANKADVNARNMYDGRGPLHEAAHADRKDIAELLLAHKAVVNAKDNEGETPLHWASLWGSQNVAGVLLR